MVSPEKPHAQKNWPEPFLSKNESCLFAVFKCEKKSGGFKNDVETVNENEDVSNSARSSKKRQRKGLKLLLNWKP